MPTSTLDGFEFDPSAPVWRLAARSGPVSFDFGRDIPAVADLRACEKEVMTRLIASNQAITVRAHHAAFAKLVGLAASRRSGKPVTELVAADLRRLVATTSPGKEHRIVAVRDLVLAWAGCDVPGLAPDLVALARATDASVPPAGRAVGMLCPNEGSLSEAEMERLVDALHAAFDKGTVALDNYQLCLTATTVVMRPLQASLLKVGDLSRGAPGSGVAFVLSVPRVKQGGAMRELFAEVELTGTFGGLLWRQRDTAILSAHARSIPEQQAPLFPGQIKLGSHGSPAARLPGLAGHMSRHAVSQRVCRVLNGLGIRSDRTGELLNLHYLRLRRTAATLSYASGSSLAKVGALLGQTDPGACVAYVERSQELFARVAAAGGRRHAGIARAMLRGRAGASATDAPDNDLDGEDEP